MTTPYGSDKLQLAYQRVSALLTNLAEERSELGALVKELLPDLELLRPAQHPPISFSEDTNGRWRGH